RGGGRAVRRRGAVGGVGYLGRFHAEKYAAHPGAELVGVVDVDAERAREVAAALGIEAFTDHRALAARVDCASVAVPTQQHFEVARDLLAAGIDVPVEKPVTTTVHEAVGVPVLTSSVDIANARLRFANGCIANVTASRVSMKRERKIRIFQADAYLAVDYGERRVRICRREPDLDGQAALTLEEREVPEGDALEAEIDAFLHAVRAREAPAVSGWDGLRALEVAHVIRASLE